LLRRCINNPDVAECSEESIRARFDVAQDSVESVRSSAEASVARSNTDSGGSTGTGGSGSLSTRSNQRQSRSIQTSTKTDVAVAAHVVGSPCPIGSLIIEPCECGFNTMLYPNTAVTCDSGNMVTRYFCRNNEVSTSNCYCDEVLMQADGNICVNGVITNYELESCPKGILLIEELPCRCSGVNVNTVGTCSILLIGNLQDEIFHDGDVDMRSCGVGFNVGGCECGQYYIGRNTDSYCYRSGSEFRATTRVCPDADLDTERQIVPCICGTDIIEQSWFVCRNEHVE
jgi:hypothetical protein